MLRRASAGWRRTASVACRPRGSGWACVKSISRDELAEARSTTIPAIPNLSMTRVQPIEVGHAFFRAPSLAPGETYGGGLTPAYLPEGYIIRPRCLKAQWSGVVIAAIYQMRGCCPQTATAMNSCVPMIQLAFIGLTISSPIVRAVCYCSPRRERLLPPLRLSPRPDGDPERFVGWATPHSLTPRQHHSYAGAPTRGVC